MGYERGDIVRVVRCDDMPDLVGKECKVVFVFGEDTYKIAYGFSDVGRWFKKADLEPVVVKRPARRPRGYKPRNKKG